MVTINGLGRGRLGVARRGLRDRSDIPQRVFQLDLNLVHRPTKVHAWSFHLRSFGRRRLWRSHGARAPHSVARGDDIFLARRRWQTAPVASPTLLASPAHGWWRAPTLQRGLGLLPKVYSPRQPVPKTHTRHTGSAARQADGRSRTRLAAPPGAISAWRNGEARAGSMPASLRSGPSAQRAVQHRQPHRPPSSKRRSGRSQLTHRNDTHPL